MTNKFLSLFPKKAKPVIGVIHLGALMGSPLYDNNPKAVYEQALREAAIFERYVDGIIIENFGDAPFYPDCVPVETVAAMTAIGRDIRQKTNLPLGINVLRNDAAAAMAIATAIEAQFIRVNVHLNAVVADQGIIEGKAYETLRLKKRLGSDVLVLGDVAVKHASPLAGAVDLGLEVKELVERGLADGLIVSGSRTGVATNVADLLKVKANTATAVLIGSGMTAQNFGDFGAADGFIVGSFFKENGRATNQVEEKRVAEFMEAVNEALA